MGMAELIQFLAAQRIDYVLVGGLAVALHGYPRVTMDVDIVLAMEPDNLRRFIDAALEGAFAPPSRSPLMTWLIPPGSSNGIAKRHAGLQSA